MWLWDSLVEKIPYFLIFTGISGYVVSVVLNFTPVINLYKPFIRIISVLLIVSGVWFAGVRSGINQNETEWQNKIDIVEKKVRDAEIKADGINDQLRTEQEENARLREQKNKTVIQYLDSWITKEVLRTVEGPERVRIEKVIEYIERCPVPKEMIDAHNAAAKGEGMKK